MHRWLRAGGRLVNMQPTGRALTIEVGAGEQRTPVGVVEITETGRRDIRSAQAALVQVARSGLFAWGPTVVCDLEFHYRTRNDWENFLQRPKTGAIVADPARLEPALAALARGVATVVTTEETVFSMLESRTSEL